MMNRLAAAQTMTLPEEIPGDTVVTAILPAAAYASDMGLLGSVIYTRFRYHPLAVPYESMTEVRVQASTKGLLDFRIRHDMTETFGSSIRSFWMLHGERYPNENYFGIGNQTPFDDDQWDDQHYFYDVIRLKAEWSSRYNLYQRGRRGGRLDLKGTTSVSYQDPDVADDNLLGSNNERPRGSDGGWMNTIGTGLLWENRDSESAATRGNRAEFSFDWASPWLLSDYPMATFSGDVRQYVTLPVPYFYPVLALRMAGSRAFGSIPFWKYPHLGDEYTLRGYPQFRFRGDAALFYNAELRTWVYQYHPWALRIGIHGFHDAGRVFHFDDGDALDDIFNDYHRTFGFGVAGSIFTPDFILRLDVGFSDEMYRIYANIGYMF